MVDHSYFYLVLTFTPTFYNMGIYRDSDHLPGVVVNRFNHVLILTEEGR